jgi:hypothetical protein
VNAKSARIRIAVYLHIYTSPQHKLRKHMDEAAWKAEWPKARDARMHVQPVLSSSLLRR